MADHLRMAVTTVSRAGCLLREHPELATHLGIVRARLLQDFSGIESESAVEDAFDSALGELADARVLQFLPILIERRARILLRDRPAGRSGTVDAAKKPA